MPEKTIIAYTDEPEKWVSSKQKSSNNINLIITNDITSQALQSTKTNTDLLIISQQNTSYNSSEIEQFTTSSGHPYTLLVPPERADEFIRKDLIRFTSGSFFESLPQQIPGSIHTTPQSNETCLNGYLLGPFHILLNGLLLGDFGGRKSKSLLAYLLYHNSRPSFRDTLMEKFWPDVDANSARNSLNVAIHSIRSVFRKLAPQNDLLVYKNERYFINPAVEVKLDHEDFLYHLGKGKRVERESGMHAALSDYEEAVRLYRGDFLEESHYDEWSTRERTALREGYCHALDRLSAHYCSAGKYKLAQHYCRKLLEKDSCREDIHRRMMRCLYLTGYRDLAVKQFQKCEQALLLSLDMHPGQATRELLEEIKRS